MSDGRPAPCDLDAEAHLIGACILSRQAIEATSLIITPEDFLKPANGHTYEAICELWRKGEPVDARIVADKLAGQGLPAADLIAATSGVPALGHAEKYARIVATHAARRRLIAVAGELAEGAYQLDDPGDLLDATISRLQQVELPISSIPADLRCLDDLLDAPADSRSPWVVPGLIRRDWRVIVVAPEGAGKSFLLHLIALASAQGTHPLSCKPIPPVRVLVIDLENPEDRIVEGCTIVRSEVKRRTKDYDPRRVMLWHRQGGIDLRSRANVAEFEAVLESTRPELVVMGPMYKASVRHKGEGWDEGAAAAQRVLDGLRTRFRFGLLLEDHAPQSSNGVRDLRPFGSSLWLRWPEIGLKLVPDSEPPAPRSLQVKRWRGDRLPNDWPERLEEGQGWPWIGVWKHGVPEVA